MVLNAFTTRAAGKRRASSSVAVRNRRAPPPGRRHVRAPLRSPPDRGCEGSHAEAQSRGREKNEEGWAFTMDNDPRTREQTAMTTDTRLLALLDEQEIRGVADLLFIHTDAKDWAAARALFVEGPVEVDMSSLVGGGPVRMTAAELFAGFEAGLHEGKASHHMASNYRVTLDGGRAELWAHGYAWNRLAGYHGGSELWETWGNYRLTFRRTGAGWRLDGFRYHAKLNRGNEHVRAHTR